MSIMQDKMIPSGQGSHVSTPKNAGLEMFSWVRCTWELEWNVLQVLSLDMGTVPSWRVGGAYRWLSMSLRGQSCLPSSPLIGRETIMFYWCIICFSNRTIHTWMNSSIISILNASSQHVFSSTLSLQCFTVYTLWPQRVHTVGMLVERGAGFFLNRPICFSRIELFQALPTWNPVHLNLSTCIEWPGVGVD